ncbi:LacI family DNA-binding transcriptional regulator [Maribacter sp. ACAM166]|uniref:LacI family DNA-binding transcriptional regulator n=1 Tax=Maribacter sp. ACAM166 TaxID=2508996 RepID=UPI0010FE7A4F|nr:LacI family DNA-binding transcriptional regulator [Maribacter sp. ACAM166]TLP70538.1 LacI family transcriptional regulator [Maribacter sp. ACAM166]
MSTKVSLKDIAKIVGVSIPLVSYVLNGKGKENRVSEETEKRIKEVAKSLNYRPNLNARSLKTNKTRTIGVILADISNPFFSNLARIIEDEAFNQNYTVIFGSSDEKMEKFDRVLELLLDRQVDGLIIAPPQGSKQSILKLKLQKIPFVLIDRYFEGLEYNYVVADNFNASSLATNYLINKGHKKIATIGYQSDLSHYTDRYEGYIDALNCANIIPSENMMKRVNHLYLKRDMKKAMDELINRSEVEAIYFQTNTLAEEGLRQLISLGRDVLQRIDVVVFDQNSTYHFLENFVPYISQPIKKMGEEALRILIENINHPDSKSVQIKLNTSLEFES